MKKIDISGSVKELKKQQSNIVFYSLDKDKYCLDDILDSEIVINESVVGLRRGVMPIQIDHSILEKMYDANDKNDLLIDLRNSSYEDTIKVDKISNSLNDLMYNNNFNSTNLENIFNNNGIDASEDFNKFLFVAPYSAYGKTLRVLVPAQGVENISWHMLRNAPRTDSIVYNIALGSEESYYHLISNKDFDVIGISPLVINGDAKIIANTSLESPESILMVGGPAIRHIPYDIFLDSFPADLMVYGKGEDTCEEIAKNLIPGSRKSKQEKLISLSKIPNIALRFAKDDYSFKKEKINKTDSLRKLDDIPTDIKDVIHRESYTQKRQTLKMTESHLIDHVGEKRLVIEYSDHCKGKCIFCNAPKNQNKKKNINTLISEIKEKLSDSNIIYDSIHFIDNTFSTHKKDIMEIADILIEQDIKIPKAAKLRADDANQELLNKLASAGFTRLFYGIESFDNSVLEYLSKGTNEYINKSALDMTLQAGITPGLNLIIPTPADTYESLNKTISETLKYVSKGCTLNIVPYLYADYNTPLFYREPNSIEYEDLFVEGMRNIYRNPKAAMLPNFLKEISDVSQENVSKRIKNYESEFNKSVSIHDYSLMYLSEVSKLVGNSDNITFAEDLIFNYKGVDIYE